MRLAIVSTGVGATIGILPLAVAEAKIDTGQRRTHQFGITLYRKTVVWSMYGTDVAGAQEGNF